MMLRIGKNCWVRKEAINFVERSDKGGEHLILKLNAGEVCYVDKDKEERILKELCIAQERT